jgi:hypothetical protein
LRLELVKTRLRNRPKNVTLEQILQVAPHGPSLRDFIDNGMRKQALTYFFSMTKRNAKALSHSITPVQDAAEEASVGGAMHVPELQRTKRT